MVDYFWRCVLTKRFNNAADANTDADLPRIQTILKGKQPTQERIELSPKSIFENGRFILSSGYVLGLLCLMAQRNPQSLSAGTRVEITNAAISKSAKKQYHHFFPKQSKVILNNKEYKNVVNNIINIVFMDSRTNNQIKNCKRQVVFHKKGHFIFHSCGKLFSIVCGILFSIPYSSVF